MTTLDPVIARSPGRLAVPASLALGLPLLLLAIGWAVSVGATSIPLRLVAGIALDHLWPGVLPVDWSPGRAAIVWDIRFPRVLLAAMVGAGLALVGTALQAVTRNPLADPHLLGVSSGASFGAILALLHVGLIFGLMTLPLFAFVGAMAATALVVVVARLAGTGGADHLILSGVSVSFVVMATANLLIFLGDPRASHTVIFWMLGGLGLAEWRHLVYPLAVLVAGGLWLSARGAELTALTIGDETTASLAVQLVADSEGGVVPELADHGRQRGGVGIGAAAAVLDTGQFQTFEDQILRAGTIAFEQRRLVAQRRLDFGSVNGRHARESEYGSGKQVCDDFVTQHGAGI